MIPEILVAMFACARIGAPHSIVVCETRLHTPRVSSVLMDLQFGGFSSEALADRIMDCKAKVLITAGESRISLVSEIFMQIDGVYRGPKLIQLHKIATDALHRCDQA